jgi:hypothetical protein
MPLSIVSAAVGSASRGSVIGVASDGAGAVLEFVRKEATMIHGQPRLYGYQLWIKAKGIYLENKTGRWLMTASKITGRMALSATVFVVAATTADYAIENYYKSTECAS